MRPWARARGLAAIKRCFIACGSSAAARSAFIMPVSLTGPGQTALTRIWSPAWQSASDLVNAIKAALLVE